MLVNIINIYTFKPYFQFSVPNCDGESNFYCTSPFDWDIRTQM